MPRYGLRVWYTVSYRYDVILRLVQMYPILIQCYDIDALRPTMLGFKKLTNVEFLDVQRVSEAVRDGACRASVAKRGAARPSRFLRRNISIL